MGLNFKKLVGSGGSAAEKNSGASDSQVSAEEKVELPLDQKGFRAAIKQNIFAPYFPKSTALERVPTGIIGLDDLIQGGFEKGSSVLLVGSAGSGKTLLGLQFLYSGAKVYGEAGLFISFEEDRESLFRHSSVFNWDFEGLEKKGLFHIVKYKPHQVQKLMKEGGGTIKDLIKSTNTKRLVLDSITSYGLLFQDEYTKRENILELFDLLENWGCTSLVIAELPVSPEDVRADHVGFLTDAIIAMYYAKQGAGVRTHACEILKMRGTQHTNKLLALRFEKKGITIYPDVEVF